MSPTVPVFFRACIGTLVSRTFLCLVNLADLVHVKILVKNRISVDSEPLKDREVVLNLILVIFNPHSRQVHHVVYGAQLMKLFVSPELFVSRKRIGVQWVFFPPLNDFCLVFLCHILKILIDLVESCFLELCFSKSSFFLLLDRHIVKVANFVDYDAKVLHHILADRLRALTGLTLPKDFMIVLLIGILALLVQGGTPVNARVHLAQVIERKHLFVVFGAGELGKDSLASLFE